MIYITRKSAPLMLNIGFDLICILCRETSLLPPQPLTTAPGWTAICTPRIRLDANRTRIAHQTTPALFALGAGHRSCHLDLRQPFKVGGNQHRLSQTMVARWSHTMYPRGIVGRDGIHGHLTSPCMYKIDLPYLLLVSVMRDRAVGVCRRSLMRRY